MKIFNPSNHKTKTIKTNPQKTIYNEIVGVENIQPIRNEFQKMIPHSICSIVKGFKIGVTKWFRINKDSRII